MNADEHRLVAISFDLDRGFSPKLAEIIRKSVFICVHLWLIYCDSRAESQLQHEQTVTLTQNGSRHQLAFFNTGVLSDSVVAGWIVK